MKATRYMSFDGAAKAALEATQRMAYGKVTEPAVLQSVRHMARATPCPLKPKISFCRVGEQFTCIHPDKPTTIGVGITRRAAYLSWKILNAK